MNNIINYENVWGITIITTDSMFVYIDPPYGDAKNLHGNISGIRGDVSSKLSGCCSRIHGNATTIEVFSNNLDYLYNLFSFLGKNYILILDLELGVIDILVIDPENNSCCFTIPLSKTNMLDVLINKVYIEKQKFNKRKLLSNKTKNLINSSIITAM